MVDKKDILELMVHFERVVNKMKMFQQKPQDYGTGEPIYYSELELIKSVAKFPDKNISEIAKMFGFTKGAISQVANKLVERGYLRKFKFEDNKKEIYLKLTDKGKKVVEGAFASYEEPIKEMLEFFEGDETKLQTIHDFLSLGERIIENAE